MVERFDWKARIALRKKRRISWDAVRQLARYCEVVGDGQPISEQARSPDDLFRDGHWPPAEPLKSR